MTNQSFDIHEYVALLKRGKYFLIIPLIFSVICGVALALKLPRVYRSEAKIFYLMPQIPDEMLTSAVNMDMETIVVYAESFVFTRDKSLKIINELNLYQDLLKKLPVDDVISHMKDQYKRKNTYVPVPVAGGRTQDMFIGFEFFFEDRNPKKAFQVANIIASAFIEQYRKMRESRALQTSSFFEEEQLRLREEMAELDKKISQFKEKNVTELPELFQVNYSMIEKLNQQLLVLDQHLQFLKDRKLMIESQLATIDPFIHLEGISGERIVTPEEKLASLKSELAILLTSVSEKHPDVIRAKKEITALEKILKKKEDGPEPKNKDAEHESYWAKRLKVSDNQAAYNPTYVNFLTQLEETNLEIESTKQQKEKITKDMEIYQKRIEKTPLVEKQYNLMMRDLDSAKKRYQELVNQALELDSSAAMEKREMGGKFIIAGPPTFPLKPVRPNRPLIVGASFIIGLGLGILLLLTWELLNQTVRSAKDLSKITAIPVLLEIPEITSKKREKTKKIIKFAIPLLCIISVPIALMAINKFYRRVEIDIALLKVLNLVKEKLAVLGL